MKNINVPVRNKKFITEKAFNVVDNWYQLLTVFGNYHAREHGKVINKKFVESNTACTVTFIYIKKIHEL